MMRPWRCAIFALVCLSIVSLGTSADAQTRQSENLRAGLFGGSDAVFHRQAKRLLCPGANGR